MGKDPTTMCQSKAAGGRRCAYHLEQGVCAGMVTYVVSVTGLDRCETSEAYKALEKEGSNLPDPTRDEVDDFLNREAFRIRHEPNLSEQRRENIVNRLLASVGRITPSGATFHAWKNLVAESWARVRRRAAAAFVLGAMTFSVGGCGNAPAEPQAQPQAQIVAAAPTAPGPASSYDTTYKTAKPTYSADAVTVFGKADVVAGTSAAVNFTQKHAFDDASVTTKAGENINKYGYSLAKDMSPETGRMWKASVDEFVQDVEAGTFGESPGSANVLSLTFYASMSGKNHDMDGNSVMANPEGPVIVNKEITSITTGATNDGRLSVEINSAADMRLLVEGKPKLSPMTRTATYYMAKSGGDWKIDAWSGIWGLGTMRADK
jgi:hypothetical protein